MGNWYVLRARDELMTADFLREANFMAYVPCEIVERKVCRKKTWVPRPLWPGYVFVHCSDQAFSAVRAIGSSEDFVRYTDPLGVRVPLRLPHGALIPVILAEACGDFDNSRQPPPWEPARGDAVMIGAGLWRGYLGEILSIGNNKKALVSFMGVKKEFLMGDLELAA
jgi:transcription antitermination factor NusG